MATCFIPTDILLPDLYSHIPCCLCPRECAAPPHTYCTLPSLLPQYPSPIQVLFPYKTSPKRFWKVMEEISAPKNLLKRSSIDDWYVAYTSGLNMFLIRRHCVGMGEAGPRSPWSRTNGLGTGAAAPCPGNAWEAPIPGKPEFTPGRPNADAGCKPAEFANRFIRAARAWEESRIPPPISVARNKSNQPWFRTPGNSQGVRQSSQFLEWLLLWKSKLWNLHCCCLVALASLMWSYWGSIDGNGPQSDTWMSLVTPYLWPTYLRNLVKITAGTDLQKAGWSPEHISWSSAINMFSMRPK